MFRTACWALGAVSAVLKLVYFIKPINYLLQIWLCCNSDTVIICCCVFQVRVSTDHASTPVSSGVPLPPVATPGAHLPDHFAQHKPRPLLAPCCCCLPQRWRPAAATMPWCTYANILNTLQGKLDCCRRVMVTTCHQLMDGADNILFLLLTNPMAAMCQSISQCFATYILYFLKG